MDERFTKPWPLPSRREHIRELMRNPSGETYPVEFQGELKPLSVYRISLEFPVYRLANGRTSHLQEERIAKDRLDADFFTRDPESQVSLAVQCDILRGMVNEENLLDYFKKNKQTEPLILTEEGYVVNGNRRLCAMRMLVSESPTKYEHFDNVRVVFLPHATEDDLDALEAALQIQPDIKAKYAWLGTAVTLRRRQESRRYSDARLAQIHRMSEAEVRETLGLLDDVDHYLASNGWPREYSRVASDQYAFEQMRRHRKAMKEQADQDLFTCLCHVAIASPRDAGGRLYAVVGEIAKNLERIRAAIANDARSAPGKAETTTGTSDAEGVLGLGSGNGDGSGLPITRLADVVSDPGSKEMVRDHIIDVIEMAKEEAKGKSRRDGSLSLLQKAHANLRSALNALSSESNLNGAAAHLDEMESLILSFRQRMDKHASR